jgi:hypothetical protein
MQLDSFKASTHHASSHAHVFLVALDHYGQVYRLDQTTTCAIRRRCLGGGGGANVAPNSDDADDADEYRWDRTTGTCTKTGFSPPAAVPLSTVPVVGAVGGAGARVTNAYPLYLTGNEGVAINGRIQFQDLIVRATPQPNHTYSVAFDCRVYVDGTTGTTGGTGNTTTAADDVQEIVLTPTVHDVLRVNNCGGGTQLTSALSCQTCIPGRYRYVRYFAVWLVVWLVVCTNVH